MKKPFAVFALLALSSIPTLAQGREGETPLVEVNAGYTYMRWEVPPALFPPPNHYNYNGFNAGGAYNFKNWLAAALDVSGVYNSQPNTGSGPSNTNIYSFLAGPRVYPLGHHRLSPYVHALFGVAKFELNVPAFGGGPAFSESGTNFAFDFGGGVDWSLGRHFAWRVGQVDFERTQALHTIALESQVSPDNQNNFKFSTGLVIRLGSK